MEITIDQLLQGKQTRIKDKDYFPTRAYVEPFLEKMSKLTNDFRVKVELPDQITLTSNGEINQEDITYNRVWVQAVMPPEYVVDNHDEVVGMIFGLDTRKPVAKFYRGGLNKACTNLCVFSPSFLQTQEIAPNSALDYEALDYIQGKAYALKAYLDRLHNTPFYRDDQYLNEELGKWVRNCLNIPFHNGVHTVKLAVSTAIDAYKLLIEKEESPYFIKPESNSTMFNVYNAFTELISNDKDKDIMNKCEKTLLLNHILGIEI